MRHGEVRCPSCEIAIGDRTVVARSAGAMIVFGLALTGCPADDGNETMGGDSSATAPTASSTMGETGTSSATEGEESSTAPETTAVYGTVATSTGEESSSGTTGSGSESGTATDTDTDGTSSGTDTDPNPTSGPGPLYGAAET